MKKIFFLLCVFVSCNSSENEDAGSEHALPKQKMVEILTDIHIAEAAIKVNAVPVDSIDDYLEKYYDEIYALHKTNKEEFKRSFRFYSGIPVVLDSIYEEVLISLSKKQAMEVTK